MAGHPFCYDPTNNRTWHYKKLQNGFLESFKNSGFPAVLRHTLVSLGIEEHLVLPASSSSDCEGLQLFILAHLDRLAANFVGSKGGIHDRSEYNPREAHCLQVDGAALPLLYDMTKDCAERYWSRKASAADSYCLMACLRLLRLNLHTFNLFFSYSEVVKERLANIPGQHDTLAALRTLLQDLTERRPAVVKAATPKKKGSKRPSGGKGKGKGKDKKEEEEGDDGQFLSVRLLAAQALVNALEVFYPQAEKIVLFLSLMKNQTHPQLPASAQQGGSSSKKKQKTADNNKQENHLLVALIEKLMQEESFSTILLPESIYTKKPDGPPASSTNQDSFSLDARQQLIQKERKETTLKKGNSPLPPLLQTQLLFS